ncbi:class I SAM-dependent methyltransferase [Dactylosporangium aurantiacum]|uniref:Class I SAM-dependent methyltransferase n=1 Tax=Dactylosporangium aurantiacum TaxID=35754 RepID=A0A9Q9IEB3_9ACTN|nr:class I SAM-dependent methyltransferase [Dactylosporangium aurantiacum]MDG6103653.1 class I SAM-dependent methyltransferase [Dactylosporangium aurantiacum]UWZ51859.1 class I SAM-dependent methyltransferase [Dactylosporangium aurantiacum]
MEADERRRRVRAVRARLGRGGPTRARGPDPERVTLPARDCDLLRDLLVAEGAQTVVEIGLAYGSSALAIAEALLTTGAPRPRHVVVDPFQRSAFADAGLRLLRDAGLDDVSELIALPSSLALPRLVADGVVADAAFVDGSHRFHEVFVDLYFLRQLVRPGGVIVLDDDWTPAVRAALRYYEHNLGWTPLPAAFATGTHRRVADDPAAEPVPRCRAVRLPDPPFEPPFESFQPFC